MLGYSAIFALLVIPLALNIYEPRWNAFLKELPYFRNSSNLLRFFSTYIPVLIVVAAIALDRVKFPAALTSSGAVLIAAMAIAICSGRI